MASKRYSKLTIMSSSQKPLDLSARSLALIVTLVFILATYRFFYTLEALQAFTATNDDLLHGYCDHISAISSEEFMNRQNNLSQILQDLGASAYIAEPGANTQFFGNFSNVNWRLSERPLLMIVLAQTSEVHSGTQIIILTPKFEATRAKTLPLPSSTDTRNDLVRFIEWAEESDPYSVALSAIPRGPESTVFVDQSVRKFIADGFQRADPTLNVVSAPLKVTHLRERKSEAEIRILKCVNEATLLSIRHVHKRLYAGIQESQARKMIADSLQQAGLKEGGCLTLFGENAALPHGSGTDRILKPEEFVLFDCTASLHGYYSDVTRTLALLSGGSQGPSSQHQKIWEDVRNAQERAFNAVKAGVITSDIDKAARDALEESGFAEYFTHRLGHGIGLEVHEQPYLRGGSNDIISTGHTFSNEPGVYIEGQVGVRLEDCFFIDLDGYPRYLTEGVGGPSHSPWDP
ncbi:hypothetical protein CVT24_010572 [Panaeolus cyanescens]|uniref:Peptidase M24 domain-containing protein n=1 Tax=Panaeolus cyanescens TaxID=181874 RepID=A0A409YYM6_9AGAR|nr:hypothetical protein CVT24_010572 [Panaeolus cyanescens]